MTRMEPILADTLRFRVARLLAQRNAALSQRNELASAIGAHRRHHSADFHQADNELWNAFMYVMREQLRVSAKERRDHG
jgi:hypothetical protein